MPHLKANKMEGYCKNITDVLDDADKTEDIIARAAAVIEQAANGNFDRDNIRTEPFTQKVIEISNHKALAEKWV